MDALVYTGPEALAFREASDPVPGAGEELVRVARVGICGSDMHAFLGHDDRRPAPLILGHEAAGVIVGGARDGVRVTVNPLVNCGTCDFCLEGRENLCPKRQIISMPPREGAFAQMVAMRSENLIPIPDDMPFEKAALAEPLAVCWHAVRLGVEALKGRAAHQCLVIGGGAIGLGSALALRGMTGGEVTIVEPNEVRRAYLNARGHHTVSPDELTGDGTYHIVVDAVGYEATRATASAEARPGGVILHVGLGSATGGIDVRRLTLQEITFIGTYTYTAQDFRETVAAMADGRLGPLDWIETRTLAEGQSAFDDIRAGKVEAPKIILNPET